MFRIENHGGDCCGKKHIHSIIPQQINEIYLRQLENTVRHYEGRYNSKTLEIVLNDTQMKSKYIRPFLNKMKELGFYRVDRTFNGVHGSWINTFHWNWQPEKKPRAPRF